MQKPKLGIFQNPSLPQHLIISEILIKLPVKSLIRFKSVSKEWQSIISSPRFAKIHLGYSDSDPSNLGPNKTLFIHSDGSCDLISSKDTENNEEKSWDSIKIKSFNHLHMGSGFRVVGSCNGLVCFYLKQSNSFCIWNPCVDQFSQILFPESVCFNVGFGYVPGLDDYKIFAIGLSSEPRERSAFIYSLKTNKWCKIAGHAHELAGYSMDGVLVDETLYWACKKIVGFNLGDNTFHEVPRTQLGNSFICMGLSALDGSLCAWDYERECLAKADALELCMYKYQSSSKCWTKLFKFDVSSLGLYVRGFFGAAGGGEVLVQRNHELEVELFRGCIDKNATKFVSLAHGTGHVVSYKESLISPNHWQDKKEEKEGEAV